MADLIIRNGALIDPAFGREAKSDLVIENGLIVAHDAKRHRADQEIDATGLLVTPGFVDLHVHLREPGKEAAETIATGTAAAVAGGFTTIVAMPNTTPPIDRASLVQWVIAKAESVGVCQVLPAGCITVGRAGRELADLAAMAEAGAVAFTDDGNGVPDEALMREACVAARDLNTTLMSHCEDRNLARDGVMHQGDVSSALGLPGQPAAAEEVMAARDIALAKLTGARLHLQHVSSAGTVELVRAAKRQGVALTAEATPHHLTLTDEDLRSGDASLKMNPPVRTAADREALRLALRDGTLDCVGTDHAPHTIDEKGRGLLRAPFGCIGMESAFGILWTELVAPGFMAAADLIRCLTIKPARILGLDGGTLALGAPADVAIIDPRRVWVIEPDTFRSRARNCPFAGRRVTGKVVVTIVDGVIRYTADAKP